MHCARCLVGEWIYEVNGQAREVTGLTLQNGIHYLCGVTQPYDWTNNFHLAFEPADGEDIVFDEHGITGVVKNARRIPIVPDCIDLGDPHANDREYSTCRNWQFAWMIRGRVEDFSYSRPIPAQYRWNPSELEKAR